VYIDSNVFILPVLGEKSDRARGARKALERIEAQDLVAYTSVLTWDEVVWVVSRVLGRPDGIQVGKKLLNFPGLRFIDATTSIITKAQSISDSRDLAPRDAIHCASAIAKGIFSLVSDDSDLEVVTEIKRIPLDSFLTSGINQA
jgi:predicted nucleic acid-binding protein